MTPGAVVVGSSVAGVRTAQALVAEHYPGPVVVVGEETSVPYDKPPLSKDLLVGKVDPGGIGLLRVAEAGIELRLGERAERLDPARHQLHLQSGELVDYDHLVVATGCRARPSPWVVDGKVLVLRTLEDALALRRRLAGAGSVAVIGAGFIGAEVAASARSMGLDVTMIDPLEVPMARVVGEEAGRLLIGLHVDHGAAVRLGTGVEGIDDDGEGVAVHLTDDSVVRASLAVVGIGAQPNDGWLGGSGLRISDGVVCDEFCRAVGAPDVLAAGDIARWYHPRHGDRVRVEHWTNAVDQAACAAHNIVHPDQPRPYQPVEYVWTDQYDWKVQIAGRPDKGVEAATVGSPGGASRWAMAYAGADDELAGTLTVNWPRGLVECRRLLAAASSFAVAVDRLRQLYA